MSLLKLPTIEQDRLLFYLTVVCLQNNIDRWLNSFFGSNPDARTRANVMQVDFTFASVYLPVDDRRFLYLIYLVM